MKQSVTIVGAGIGGLSVAHELVRRGFKVKVYERRMAVGGKALSGRALSEAFVDLGAVQLPTEHGFRFFPGWYRHLIATMREIPIAARTASFPEVSVATNLVRTETSRMLWADRPHIPVPMHLPRSLSQAKGFADFLLGMSRLGLANGEIAFFLGKVAMFLAMPEETRLTELQKVTWWDYVEAEKKSHAYQDLIAATTRTLIAANAKEASAYTLGRLAIRTLSDAFGGIDHVLNGPTSEAWLESWRLHLQNEGVEFMFGSELDSINLAEGERKVSSISVSSVAAGLVRKLRRLLPGIAEELDRLPSGAPPVELPEGPAEDIRMARSLIDEIKEHTTSMPEQTKVHLFGALAALCWRLDEKVAWPMEEQPILAQSEWRKPFNDSAKGRVDKTSTVDLCRVVSQFLWDFEEDHPSTDVPSDHFVFALPVEQMAYYVQRSAALTTLDPKLGGIVQLANSTDWMAGIQFYLKERVELGKGHLILMDSPWALTAVEQRQFWPPSTSLSPRIQAIISVDVANWSVPGRYNRKKAQDCTDQEIAKEVWSELRAAHNRSGQKEVLSHGMLLGHEVLGPRRNFWLDRSIVDLFDRKKQAAFEKARSVQLSTLDGKDPRATAMPYLSGPRLRFNSEPLLINRTGTWELRPTAKTGIDNMYLAADYVRTETDLACMEGANEAARRAVNALLDATGSTADRCEIWPFSVPQNLASQLLAIAQLDDVSSIAAATTGLARVADGAADLMTRAGDALRGFLKKG